MGTSGQEQDGGPVFGDSWTPCGIWVRTVNKYMLFTCARMPPPLPVKEQDPAPALAGEAALPTKTSQGLSCSAIRGPSLSPGPHSWWMQW